MAKLTDKVRTTTLDQLKVGDIVWNHGARLRLVALLDSGEGRSTPDSNDAHNVETFRCFDSEYLGDVDPRYPTQIPKDWLKKDPRTGHGFIVQSNALHRWAAEIA